LERPVTIFLFRVVILILVGVITALKASGAGTLELLYPDGGEVLIVGENCPITWSGGANDVYIEYSADSGNEWTPIDPNNPAQGGTYLWLVPMVTSQECLVRIIDANEPDVFDISDEVFTIDANAISVDDDFDSSTSGWGVYRFDNIQAGINASFDEYTVYVGPGVYEGNLDFGINPPDGQQTRAITVLGVAGAEKCIIDCQDSGPGFYFHNVEGNDSIVDGFTITRGTGVNIAGYAVAGGAVCCRDNSSPIIRNCIIVSNTAESGGGIACYNYSSALISNCIITDNSATDGTGGGIDCYQYAQNVQIADCTITGNVADFGGGLHCEYHSNVTISRCRISGNKAYEGAGLECAGLFSEATVVNSIISGNWAVDNGGAAESYDRSALQFFNSNLADNVAGELGSALFCDSASSGPGDVAMSNCIVWDNQSDLDPNQIYNDNDSTITVIYSCIEDPANDPCYVYPGANNIDDDPEFLMESDYEITGTWTEDSQYFGDPNNRTVLIDSAADFEPNEFAGRLITPDLTQSKQALIAANTATTVEIVGQLIGTVLADATYRIVDYRLGIDSPCIDVGDPNVSNDVGQTDIIGNPRVFDVIDRGAEATGTEYDIGPYEIMQNPTLEPNLLPAYDTGLYDDDDITNFDNSDANKKLQFALDNTVIGATITVYADGEAIGSVIAAGPNSVVTTNGSYDLIDGNHLITACQTELFKVPSFPLTALSLTVDTAEPNIDSYSMDPNGTQELGTVFAFEIEASDALSGIDKTFTEEISIYKSGVMEKVDLLPDANNFYRTTWNSSSVGTGEYLIDYEVVDIAGNTKKIVGGHTMILYSTLLGDIAPDGGDGYVNILDLARLSQAWMSEPNSANWDEHCDIAPGDGDNMINYLDYNVIANEWRDFSLLGDIAPDGGDGYVNILDLARLSQAWMSEPNSGNWDEHCDIAPGGGDNIINYLDYNVIANEWQKNTGEQ